MIGAHTLLLMIRGQNQASAALGRVARDIRGLQRQRDLRARQAQLVNRQAQQALRVQQMESFFGSRQIALAQARLRTDHQIEAVNDRTNSLELRRAGIVARGNQLLRQEARIQQSIVDLGLAQAEAGTKAWEIETRRLAQLQRIAVTEAKIADLAKAGAAGRIGTLTPTGQFPKAFGEMGIQRQQALLAQHRAQTGVLEAQLRAELATRAVRSARENEGDVGTAQARSTIANRRLLEAQKNAAIAARSIEQLNVVETRLNETLVIQQRERDKIVAGSARLIEEEKALRAQLVAVQDGWAMLSARERQVQGAEAQHLRLIEDLNARLRALTVQEYELGQAAKVAAGQLAITNAELSHTNQLVAGQRMEAWTTGARAVSHFGRVVQMTGLITTAAFGAMAVSAAKFSQETMLAATQAGMTQNQLQKFSGAIQSDVIAQMKQFPGASQDVTKGFYDILSSMDTTEKQANSMMIAFQKTAVAGMAPLNDVVNAGITIMNDYGKTIKGPDDAMNQLMATVRFGRLNVEQYTQAMNKLVPAFKNAGQPLLQMNAAFAELTRLMPSQAMAATALSRLAELFSRGTFNEGVKQFGIRIRDASGAMLPFNKIIEQFGSSMNPTIKALREGRISAQDFFKEVSGTSGTVFAQRAFTALITHSTELDKRLKQISSDGYELSRSFDAMRRTPGVEWQVFTNTMKALSIEIGFGAIRAFQKLANITRPLVQWFMRLSPHTRQLIGEFAAFASVAILAAGSLAVVIGSVTAMVLTFRTFFLNIEKVAQAFKGLGGEAGFARLAFVQMMGRALLWVGIFMALQKITGSLTKSIEDLTIAWMGWKMMAAAGMANPLGAVLVGAVVAAKIISDKFKDTQKELIKAQSYVAAPKDIQHMGTIFSREIVKMQREGMKTADIFKIMRDRLGDSDNAAAVLAYAFRHAKTEAVKMAVESAKALQARIPPGRTDPTVIPTTGATTAQLRRRLQELNQMRAIAERAPSAVRWQRYFAALEAFQKHVTNVQQQTLDQIGTLTDRQVMVMAQKVARLRAAFMRTPNTQTWQAYYAAQQALAEQATQRQQQLVQDVGIYTDREVLAMVRKATLLRAAFEKAPDAKHWRAWQAEMEKIAAGATQSQQQMAQDVEKISDNQVMAQVRNINKLARIANKSKSFADIKAYNVALQQLQDSATSTQMSAAQSFLINLDTTMKKGTKKIKDSANNARQALNQIAGTLSQTFDTIQQNNQQAFGTLGQGPFMQGARMQTMLQFGYKPTGADYLKDIRAQLSRFRQWQQVLNRLQARAGDGPGMFEMIQQLRALGPDALPMARTLLAMKPAQFRQYTQVFRQAQVHIARASRQELKIDLRHWRSLGSNIMKAILQGMDEHTAEFATYFRNMAIELFPGLAKLAKAKPRTGRDPVVVAGEPRRPGHGPRTGHGRAGPRGRTPHGTRVDGRTLSTARPAPMTNNYNTYNYEYIYQDGNMDYSTWLKKSKSHMRNRR